MTCEFIDNRRAEVNARAMTADNKTIVQKALAGLVANGDVDALGRLLTDDFVHHKPDSRLSTKTEWLAEVRAALVHIAGMEVDIQHLLADGDYVVMYSRRRLPGRGAGIAVVDVWRFDDGLIAEAWEVIEQPAQVEGNLRWWEAA